MRLIEGTLKACANSTPHPVCNWLLPAGANEIFCLSCRLNRTIPDLGSEINIQHWCLMESAKRRLLYTLLNLGIPLPTLVEDAREGLAFDIISSNLDASVTTGHLQGVITVNLDEVDDTYRQINRQLFKEESRTLLGHFRHESGHYLWYRVISWRYRDDPLYQAFNQVFGDERVDYSKALSWHYEYGPPPDWQENHITAYASSHPWEDWAETWEHYLQMVDGFETCNELGIRGGGIDLPLVILPIESCELPACLPPLSDTENGDFHAWLQRWICLTPLLNQISQSFGGPLIYPYQITAGVARKLRFAHHFSRLWQNRTFVQKSSWL